MGESEKEGKTGGPDETDSAGYGSDHIFRAQLRLDKGPLTPEQTNEPQLGHELLKKKMR